MSRDVARAVVVVVMVLAVALASVPPTLSLAGDPPSSADAERHLRSAPGTVGAETGVDPAALRGGVKPTRGEEFAGADEVHERGVTGAGVRVGVIGREFDPGHPAVADAVGGASRFGDGRLRAGSTPHDTAVAEIVHGTAPGAELYLASVGPRPTPSEYRAAVEWLVASDVDVIVDAGSYFPPSGDDMTRMTDAAEAASDAGVVFVTSAGNYATRHWSDRVAGEGWVAFDDGVEANPVGDGAIDGRLSLRLYWEGDADYDLYLYRHRPDGPDPVVAKSTASQSGTGEHSESIDVAVPEGRYYVAVHAVDAGEVPTRVDLFATDHGLEYSTAEGSMVAPATGEGVISVGAVASGAGGEQAYSSRGDGLDIAAPDGARTRSAGRLYGTSAAAPVVAGTAALMKAERDDLSPAEIRRILVRTADRRDGRARLDAEAAVRVVAEQPEKQSD